jgi:hypothetical protein
LRDRKSQTDGRIRRTNDRTLAYWNELRGDRAYPSPDDVISDTAAEGAEAEVLRRNVFVVYFDGQPLDSVFTFSSEVLESACGIRTADTRVADCLPSPLCDSMISFVRALAKARKPIAVSSSFATEKGTELLYRSIYLPLSADQENVEYLLGAFSFKETPA